MLKDEIEFYNPDASLLIFQSNSVQSSLYSYASTYWSQPFGISGKNSSWTQMGIFRAHESGRMGLELRQGGVALFWMLAGLSGPSLVSVSPWAGFCLTHWFLRVTRPMTYLSDVTLHHFLHLSLSCSHSPPFPAYWLPSSFPPQDLSLEHLFLTLCLADRFSSIKIPIQKPHTQKYCKLPLPSHFLPKHHDCLQRTQGNRKWLPPFPVELLSSSIFWGQGPHLSCNCCSPGA